MDSAKLNDWLQSVGMLGLIASLVFVGMQVNQTQRAGEGAELASYLEIATLNRQLRIEHADVWQKACAGEELSAADRTKAAALYRNYLEFALLSWLGSSAGILQLDNQSIYVNRLAANIHRYPGFAELSASSHEWGIQGEGADNDAVFKQFGEAISARVAVLREIEPNPNFDVKWCGF
jgi:hypothetical protein